MEFTKSTGSTKIQAPAPKTKSETGLAPVRNSTERLIKLQKTIGNRAFIQLMAANNRHSASIQRKPYEQVSTGAGDFWYDEADPDMKQYSTYEECVEANKQYNTESATEAAANENSQEKKLEAMKLITRNKQISFIAKLREHANNIPDQLTLFKQFDVLKSKAGMNREKKVLFIETNNKLKLLFDKIDKYKIRLEGFTEDQDNSFYLLPSKEKKANVTLNQIGRKIDGFNEELGILSEILVDLIPPKPEDKGSDLNKIVVAGAHGALTAKAYNSIPAPFNDPGQLRQYLSTMSRAQGQPGIHMRTNSEVVLKFLGILGNQGIVATSVSGGKYIFSNKLSNRH
jgi:hypothetical protein